MRTLAVSARQLQHRMSSTPVRPATPSTIHAAARCRLLGLVLVVAAFTAGCGANRFTSDTTGAASQQGAPASSSGGVQTGAAPTTAVATKQNVYVPWQPEGRLAAIEITATANGTCWEGSLAASGRSDAWRCSAGNHILDPCFANTLEPTASQEICPDSRTTGTLLNLVAPLDFRRGNREISGAHPWAMELANGRFCSIVTGTATSVAGRPLTYSCTGNVFRYGEPDTTATPWNILSGQHDDSTLQPVDITTIYN